MSSLQSQVFAFLTRVPPTEVNYVPNSLAEQLLRSFAAGRLVATSPPFDLIQICEVEAVQAASRMTTLEGVEYFQLCGSLLQAIRRELEQAT